MTSSEQSSTLSQPKGTPDLQEAFRRWHAWLLSRGRANTTIRLQTSYVRYWLFHVDIGQLMPSEVTEEHVNRLVNRPGPWKATTRKAILCSLRAFLTFCRRHGWLVAEPAALVDVDMHALTHAQKELREGKPFNADEIGRLLAEASTSVFWTAAILIAVDTGLRLGDICRLEWDSVGTDVLTVWTDKSNRRVRVPLTPRAKAALERVPKGRSQYVFPKERDLYERPKRRNYFSVFFVRLSNRAGLAGRVFHDLRHTFCTNHHRQGMATRDIATLAGHSSAKTTEGYIH